MSIGAVGGIITSGGIVGPSAATKAGVIGGDGAGATSSAGFAGSLGNALQGVESAQSTSDALAKAAAVGKVDDIHEVTLAASRAQLMTDLTVAVRNKAVEAFTEIMRMQV